MRPFLPFFLICLAAAPAGAQDALSGADLYSRHCATCHGADARGQGPTGAILTLQPTDLTTLSAGNDSIFPVTRVVRRIDGTDPLVAHGSPMPIFSGFLDGGDAVIQAETGQPLLTVQAVADLVMFLQGVQE